MIEIEDLVILSLRVLHVIMYYGCFKSFKDLIFADDNLPAKRQNLLPLKICTSAVCVLCVSM